jgi:hypothetical protein
VTVILGFKAKTICSSYIFPGSSCYTYDQNYSNSDKPMSRQSTLLQEYYLITRRLNMTLMVETQ